MNMNNRKQKGARISSIAMIYWMRHKIDIWSISNTFQVCFV